MPPYTLRPLTPNDAPFLWEMLYHAIYVPAGSPPPAREIVNQPALATYVRDWGRTGDTGVLVIDRPAQQPVGAAWLRLLTGEDKGYGYIDDRTPELSIAVLPGHRGKGLGTRLLAQLFESAAQRYTAISLSVDPDNPALRLYRRLGFEVIESTGHAYIMKKRL